LKLHQMTAQDGIDQRRRTLVSKIWS